ncbi:MAG: YeaH/YhbH family protein [Inquilinus sp.]|nr:YeaH/YhbH family protein [Inquilinus sp.]
MNIVDRRLNPKGKSLGNRQRFVRRAKADIRDAVREALKQRRVSEVEGSERIRIRARTVKEPSFGLSRNDGRKNIVVPGNKEFVPGDAIPKPPPGQAGGRDGSPDGEGDDDFVFTLTKEEFLDVFFEDLELPDLLKTKIKDEMSPKPARAGFSTQGSPSSLNVLRTMRGSLARRMTLKRPKPEDIAALEAEIAKLKKKGGSERRLKQLKAELEVKQRKLRTIAYIDPIDVRYNRFERVMKPATQAVMFCLMDASASMTEEMKELGKRFFMLLHVFLSRRYRHVDIVFIRHTSHAQEVDEETFFRSTETGGTVVSSALEEMDRVIVERYPVGDWNIYGAQASDGDNFRNDMPTCIAALESRLLPVCQQFSYIEVGEKRVGLGFESDAAESPLWHGYGEVAERHRHFAMRRVATPSDIFPVFHDLFSRDAKAKA